jgi:hypothetical protein
MSQLTQIQTVRRSNPNAKEVFIYHKASGRTDYLPFRVGDIVSVTDWGESYSSYTNAFIYFTNSGDKPYYCCDDYHIEKRRREDGDKQLFKIIKIAEHGRDESIVCYVQDRAKRGVVIDARGLKLVKQFPLRKNETINIVLEKIK